MTETEATSAKTSKARKAAIVLSACLVLLFGLGLAYVLTCRKPAVVGVCIDASRPVRVSMPLQVVAIGDEGERGLWLGPQLGGGESTAEGKAEYSFYVERTGDYSLWIYSLWHGQGHNSVLIRVGSESARVGGGTTSDSWHWEKGPTLHLAEGVHRMEILTPEDNVALRKIFMIDADEVGPEECGVVVSEFFHDDFDGCNDGNFALWEQLSGRWTVEHPEWEKRPDGKTLVGSSQDTALMLMRGRDWQDYAFSLSGRVLSAGGSGSAAGMCFCVKGDREYGLLLWREKGDSGKADMQLLRMTSAGRQEVASFDVPWESGQWHDVAVELKAGALAISVDHGKKRHVDWKHDTAGGIGLWVAGRTDVEFDNIEVKPTWSMPADAAAGRKRVPRTPPAERGAAGKTAEAGKADSRTPDATEETK